MDREKPVGLFAFAIPRIELGLDLANQLIMIALANRGGVRLEVIGVIEELVIMVTGEGPARISPIEDTLQAMPAAPCGSEKHTDGDLRGCPARGRRSYAMKAGYAREGCRSSAKLLPSADWLRGFGVNGYRNWRCSADVMQGK